MSDLTPEQEYRSSATDVSFTDWYIAKLQEQVAELEKEVTNRGKHIEKHCKIQDKLQKQVAALEEELFLARTECDLCGRALKQEVKSNE